MRKLLLLGISGISLWLTVANGQISRQQIIVGPTLPLTCRIGQLFFQTTTPPISLYQCTALNTWVAAGGAVATNWGAIGGVIGNQVDLTAALGLKEDLANKDVNGGYVGRDAGGNSTISGSMTAASFSTSSADTTEIVLKEGAEVTGNPGAGKQKLFISAGHVPSLRDSAGVYDYFQTTSQTKYRTTHFGYEVGAENGSALVTADLSSHAIYVNDGNAKTLVEASCISDSGDQSVTLAIGATTLFTIHCVATGTYSRATTDGTTGYIIAASMTNTAVAAGSLIDISGVANTTTKDIKVHVYSTIN